MPEFPLTEENLLAVLLDPAQRERLKDALSDAGRQDELARRVKETAARCQATPDLLLGAVQELSGLAELCELALAGLLLHPDLPEEARKELVGRSELRERQVRLAPSNNASAGEPQVPAPDEGEAASGQASLLEQQEREVIQMIWRGFSGQAEWDAERQVYKGSLAGVPELVPFEGRSLDELEMAMREAIDLYLEMLSEGD